MCFDSGRGVEKNAAQAVKFFTEAALAGNVTAMKNLGVLFEQGRDGVPTDVMQSMSWHVRAFNGGHVNSLNALKRLAQAHPDLGINIAALEKFVATNKPPPIAIPAEDNNSVANYFSSPFVDAGSELPSFLEGLMSPAPTVESSIFVTRHHHRSSSVLHSPMRRLSISEMFEDTTSPKVLCSWPIWHFSFLAALYDLFL